MLGNIKMFVKRLPYLIIVGLVIALSVSQCQKQTIKQTVSTPDSTSYFKGKLATIQAQGKELQEKLYSDSLKTSIVLKALKHENKVLRFEIAKARIPVQVLIDSIPSLDHFVDLQDSLIQHQAKTIDTLSLERARLFKSFSSMLSNKDDQAQVMKEIINHLEFINKDLAKDVRRERRKKTFWKVATGISGVVILYQIFQHD